MYKTNAFLLFFIQLITLGFFSRKPKTMIPWGSSARRAGADLRYDLFEYINEMEPVMFTPKAEKLLPTITVTQTSGHIPVLDAGAGRKLFSGTELLRGEKGAYQRGRWILGDDSYITKVRGIEYAIDLMEDIENEDILEQEKLNSWLGKETILIHREKRASDYLFNASNWPGADDTQAAPATWATPAADTQTDVVNAGNKIKKKKGVRRKMCSLAMSTELLDDLILNNTELKSQVQYTTPLVKMSEAEKFAYLAMFYGVKEIVELDAIYNTQGYDIDAEFEDLWPKTVALLAYLSPGGNTWGAGLGRQPAYKKATQGKDMMVESYDEKNTDQYVIRTKERRGIKLFTGYGCLITGTA